MRTVYVSEEGSVPSKAWCSLLGASPGREKVRIGLMDAGPPNRSRFEGGSRTLVISFQNYNAVLNALKKIPCIQQTMLDEVQVQHPASRNEVGPERESLPEVFKQELITWSGILFTSSCSIFLVSFYGKFWGDQLK